MSINRPPSRQQQDVNSVTITNASSEVSSSTQSEASDSSEVISEVNEDTIDGFASHDQGSPSTLSVHSLSQPPFHGNSFIASSILSGIDSSRFQQLSSPGLTSSSLSSTNSESPSNSFTTTYTGSPITLPRPYLTSPIGSSAEHSVYLLSEGVSCNTGMVSAPTGQRLFSRFLGRMKGVRILQSENGGGVKNGMTHGSKMNSSSRSILSMEARRENDSMVYLEGPQIYSCSNCRTHFTSHDDIISKSFHGRHGRAYLFEQCVNVTLGPAEDRRLMTGLHSVSDIFCKRCKTMVGWTYTKAYEQSQKYKEGKYIIEKIFLYMEESNYYDVNHPAGERRDRWRMRAYSWGSEPSSMFASSEYATLTCKRRGTSEGSNNRTNNADPEKGKRDS